MMDEKSAKKQRFIPFRKRDIVEMCLLDNKNVRTGRSIPPVIFYVGECVSLCVPPDIGDAKSKCASLDPDADTRHTQAYAVGG